MSPKSEAQKRAEKNYLSKITSVTVQVPKGKKDEYIKKAEAHGMTMTAYVSYLIEKNMEV